MKGRNEKMNSLSGVKWNSDDDKMIAPRILFCDYLICTLSTSELFSCVKIKLPLKFPLITPSPDPSRILLETDG